MMSFDSSPVARYLTALADNGQSWEGTAAELLSRINMAAGDEDRRLRSWPRTPRAMSGILRRIAPNLPQAGFMSSSPGSTPGRGNASSSRQKVAAPTVAQLQGQLDHDLQRWCNGRATVTKTDRCTKTP